MMKIAVSGASGLVGSAFCEYANSQGHDTVSMVRDPDAQGIYWSVDNEAIDLEALEGFDAIVHLAGESIAGGRWTKNKKQRIKESREKGTRLIANAMASMDDPPDVLVCASGINFYADHGDEWIDEETPPGQSFLSEVCLAWEAACDPARDVARVANTRFGIVLSDDGGALERMLTPFKIGVGGRLGSGEQYMSWVDLRDVVRALLFAITEESLEGPVNVVAPNPVKNKVFTKALGKALGRPTVLPVPSPALKLALGSEMAEELLLTSLRVCPQKLLDANFQFESPTVDEALERALT